ncbi:hypothetical protein COCON_G00012460 [Conger conger]|uniref:Sialomucin core protein 24 n=1 Tax=Conger conger TaxID=82655 RepID=A0A9Q1E2U6_CONCO|nr:sialomucin core protein 24-like [Conger conger]KAJ8288587.1 hypothetical protein COCON_G00012460 [Conger conger]
MSWRLVLLTVVGLQLGSIIVSATAQCLVHAQCSDCTNDSQCQWMECADASGTSVTSCVNSTEILASECTPVSACAAPANTSTTTANLVTTHIPNTTATSAYFTVTTLSPTPTERRPTFDAASFIGGIVLVIVLQILIFVIYKFFKFREINYGTL